MQNENGPFTLSIYMYNSLNEETGYTTFFN